MILHDMIYPQPADAAAAPDARSENREVCVAPFGRGDDEVGIPHRAQIYRFELFELLLLLKLDKEFPVEQFEATVSSQSTLPSPPLNN